MSKGQPKITLFSLLIRIAFLFSLLLMTNLSQAKPVGVMTKEGNTLPLYKDYQALVIGVSDYTYLPKLPNTIKDAEEVAAQLRELGFEVRLVKDPTSAELRQILRGLPHSMGTVEERAVLIYYAGHGATEALADKSKLGYILPKDTPLQNRDPVGFASLAISMEEIDTLARRMKTRHVLMVFDSCFSGSLFAMVRDVPTDISEKVARPVRQFITAGTEEEEVPDKSTFKKVFIDGITGEADYNKDGYVTGSELGMYLQDKVVNYTRGSQHPQYGKIRNPELDKGDFVFVLPNKSGKLVAGLGVEKISNSPATKDSIPSEPASAGKDPGLQKKDEQRIKPTQSKTPMPLFPAPYTDPVTGMEFVAVNGGCYPMGDPFGDGRPDERPVHEVCLDDFYLGKYEVTQGQWRALTGSNPSFRKMGENYPVEHVSWEDVQEFIQKLNRMTGKKFRLPTEAEWEYAARSGGKKERWAGANQFTELNAFAWYGDHHSRSQRPVKVSGNSEGMTHPVGEKKPNGLGLYDINGNVWEWVEDVYSFDAYKEHTRNNPVKKGEGVSRVVRGGSWYSPPVRNFFRSDFTPSTRRSGVGFRLVLSLK